MRTVHLDTELNEVFGRVRHTAGSINVSECDGQKEGTVEHKHMRMKWGWIATLTTNEVG